VDHWPTDIALLACTVIAGLFVAMKQLVLLLYSVSKEQ
jgi:hypothetical protein